MQPADALDFDARLAGALDLRAHLVETIGEVDDLGLARRVLDQRVAMGERRGHQRGMRAADRHFGKMDFAADKTFRRGGVHIAGFDRDVAPSFSSAMRRRSTGRVPMAQPPGSETRASPMRASSGATTQKLARIFETSS